MKIFDKLKKDYNTINPRLKSGALDLFKYIGPGLLVTVGFIDPGNWASNFAAGSIFAGMYNEPYNIKDIHSKTGALISLGVALLIIFLISDPFKGLIISQAVLSLQLPITVFLQIRLTSSKEVMGKHANKLFTKCFLYFIAIIITVLNMLLIGSFIVK